jgi:hypothetical protein
MTRKTLACSAVLFLTVACGSSAWQGAETKPAAPAKAVISAKLVAKRTQAPRRERAPREVWRTGDTFVHRFNGTFRRHPLILTEKVVSVEGDYASIDLVLRDGKQDQRLRIRRNLADRRVVNVWNLDQKDPVEVGIYVYDELIAKTSFAADANEGKLEEQSETCLLGRRELTCRVTKYRVTIDGKPALLTVSKSDQVPGRDLGGSITDDEGKVIYRAELVEMSRGTTQGIAKRE